MLINTAHEVVFTNADKEKIYSAIGFKNNAGGYELRNEYFKGSSSPKCVTYLDNKADKISVFEGFFDFLSHQSIHQKQAAGTDKLSCLKLTFLFREKSAFNGKTPEYSPVFRPG